jgi:hypothetical protein
VFAGVCSCKSSSANSWSTCCCSCALGTCCPHRGHGCRLLLLLPALHDPLLLGSWAPPAPSGACAECRTGAEVCWAALLLLHGSETALAVDLGPVLPGALAGAAAVTADCSRPEGNLTSSCCCCALLLVLLWPKICSRVLRKGFFCCGAAVSDPAACWGLTNRLMEDCTPVSCRLI